MRTAWFPLRVYLVVFEPLLQCEPAFLVRLALRAMFITFASVLAPCYGFLVVSEPSVARALYVGQATRQHGLQQRRVVAPSVPLVVVLFVEVRQSSVLMMHLVIVAYVLLRVVFSA